MTAILKVDTIQDTSGNNIINESSDTITIGAAGDTVDVPGTEVKTNKVSPTSGTALQIGDSGDTITIPSGATITNSGTATGFGGGKVLQVVHAHTATVANSSSTSYADTGLTASITPSATSSKVIVIINQSVAKMGGANSYGNFKVLRDSTEIGGSIPARAIGNTNNTEEIYLGMGFNYNFQDSPSSTSSLTYKTQFNNGAGTGTIRCQPDSSQSYILLMEVAG